jgi:UDP-N-acetylmuramoyl-tripeptide--D-alanyl-D-alanine ligase
MIELSGERIAELAGARLAKKGAEGHPARAVVDSRVVEGGDLFVGLPGRRADGGQFARQVLDAGAWGVIVEPVRAAELDGAPGWVLSADDPLAALQKLASAWREEIGCRVVGITGSTGKTSVKDVCRALLGDRVHASPENYNTEVGMPLAMLMAPAATEVMVLEMAMRGPGQITELCEIATPDVAVITNVGPVHLELLGSMDAIVAAKAEIIAALGTDGVAVVPAERAALQPHLDEQSPRTIAFGAGGDVEAVEVRVESGRTNALVATPAGEQRFELPFTEAHNLENALAAIAIGVALEVPLAEMSARAPQITFSRLRGELIELDAGAIVINDCYNANPMSMRAALDHLGSLDASRKIAVLGEMAELGADAMKFHQEIGEHARGAGIDLLVGVGEPARAYGPDKLTADPAAAAAHLAGIVRKGDAILVKGSRSVGMEAVAERLLEEQGAGGGG